MTTTLRKVALQPNLEAFVTEASANRHHELTILQHVCKWCVQQRLPRSTAQFPPAWRAHSLEYLDQSSIGKTHRCVELEDALCVPEYQSKAYLR